MSLGDDTLRAATSWYILCHLPVVNVCLQVIGGLLGAGADAQATTASGATALDIAVTFRRIRARIAML